MERKYALVGAYRHFFCLISGRTLVRAKVYVKKGPITCLSNSSLGVFSIPLVKEARAFKLLDGFRFAKSLRTCHRARRQSARPETSLGIVKIAAATWQFPFHRTVFRAVTLLLRHEDEVKPHAREV